MSFFRFPTTISDALKDALKDKDAVALLEDRDRALEDYLSNTTDAPAASSGGIIGYVSVGDFGGGTYFVPISESDLDPINSFLWTVTFTVPESGAVLVEMEGVFLGDNYNDEIGELQFAVRHVEGFSFTTKGYTIVTSDTALKTYNGSGYGARLRAGIPISGLTPGEEVTFEWCAYVSMASGTGLSMVSSDNDSGGPGHAWMIVHALPA